MVDTHCHLEKESYPNLDEVIKQMGENIMITAGVDVASSLEVLDLISKYENVYGVIGLHPENVNNNENISEIIEKNINNPKILGIGEIGLDYHYEDINKELQKEKFIEQIKLAEKYNKPIVVHSRDAAQDTLQILNKYAKNVKIVLHCYSYSYELLQEFLKLNLKIGVGGVLTFKNNKKMCDIISKIDLSKILLETDSPYLSPEPLRGTKNVPYNIVYVASKIALIKGMEPGEILEITHQNACEQFDLKK